MNWTEFSQKRIAVALSGGMDSMALLHFMKAQELQYGYRVFVVHCEHGIRGEESLLDQAFVEQICKEENIPYFTFQEDCIRRAEEKKESLEETARNFRRECFAKLIEQDKVDYIATAHHLDDEAETVLFRLMRGTGLSGASGMAEQSGYLLRPFLTWTKQDIEEYVENNHVEYRTDSTNASLAYTRNKLRHQILPKLEEMVDGAKKNLTRFARLAKEDDDLLYAYAEELLSELGNGEIAVKFCDKKPLFTRACLLAMKKMGVEKDYTANHLESLFALQQLERGASLCLPQCLQAKKRKNDVVFFYPKEENFCPNSPEKKFTEDGFDGGRYEVRLFFDEQETLNNENKILRIDADKLPQNATFRFRKEGDEIKPFGGGTKSLKKFFNEREIPVEERAYIPLIAGGKEVYVVCGVEISDKVKVTENTKRQLYIKIQKKEEL